MSASKKKGFRGSIGKLFAKTDIPFKSQGKPGHTVKTKNIVYVSGSKTWKAKAQDAADLNFGDSKNTPSSSNNNTPRGATIDFRMGQGPVSPQVSYSGNENATPRGQTSPSTLVFANGDIHLPKDDRQPLAASDQQLGNSGEVTGIYIQGTHPDVGFYSQKPMANGQDSPRRGEKSGRRNSVQKDKNTYRHQYFLQKQKSQEDEPNEPVKVREKTVLNKISPAFERQLSNMMLGAAGTATASDNRGLNKESNSNDKSRHLNSKAGIPVSPLAPPPPSSVPPPPPGPPVPHLDLPPETDANSETDSEEEGQDIRGPDTNNVYTQAPSIMPSEKIYHHIHDNSTIDRASPKAQNRRDAQTETDVTASNPPLNGLPPLTIHHIDGDAFHQSNGTQLSPGGSEQSETSTIRMFMQNSPTSTGMYSPRSMTSYTTNFSSRSPVSMGVTDPLKRMSISRNSQRLSAVNRDTWSLIETQGASIDQDLVVVNIIAPNGDQVPAKIVQQPDGDFKVEYSSKYTGRHTVEILYAGQAIMGSPFYVEIYDPNKIRVEGERKGIVGQRMEFDIIRNEAGKAELGLSITGPTGRAVSYDIVPMAVGDKVTYIPTEAGPHNIYITYGGLEVPGCPITQNIIDTATGIVVSGDGLYKGIQNKPSEFRINTKGHRGDLFVHVEGPNSIARCHVEEEGSGSYTVRYTPVEAGRFTVVLKWNNNSLSGSPYHPEVLNPAGVHVIGGWGSVLDSNNQMALQVNNTKRIEFDTSMAGPGQLTCEVQGPNGRIPTFIDNQGGRWILTFTPTVEGEYYISIFWGGVHIQNSPFHGFAQNLHKINSEKVVLSGRGLKEAKVKEEAEFVIDGSQAGPGEPSVQLTGIKMDIDVQCLPIGDNKYRCSYVPKLPGAYLLNIMWSGRHVKGGPYKVNVVATSDASKVVAVGEGLKMGIMGRDIKATIDVRRAGPGELTAHCMGPTKTAICELFDHHDGTFTLSVKPAEPGRHVLQIMFGGEHVPGSPFELKIAGAPDASKVRVSGPGIEHGILATYISKFLCETKGAGAGQLTVRIRGPKGAFKVEMQRESQKDRTILCQYEPREVGDYVISVKWSGEHVPGSPFRVQIFDTQQELERFLRDHPDRRTNAPRLTNGWQEDI